MREENNSNVFYLKYKPIFEATYDLHHDKMRVEMTDFAKQSFLCPFFCVPQ